jgi:hypothetical protein
VVLGGGIAWALAAGFALLELFEVSEDRGQLAHQVGFVADEHGLIK